MDVISGLRVLSVPFLSGGVWLVAAYLWTGEKITSVLGGDCGALNGPVCSAHQHPVVRSLVTTAQAIGPAGRATALIVLAFLLGGTMNLLLAAILRLFTNLTLPMILDWDSRSEDALHRSDPVTWQTAVKLRSEGVTRIVTAPPLALIFVQLARGLSAWWILGVPALVPFVIHGYLATERYRSIVPAD